MRHMHTKELFFVCETYCLDLFRIFDQYRVGDKEVLRIPPFFYFYI